MALKDTQGAGNLLLVLGSQGTLDGGGLAGQGEWQKQAGEQ